MKKFISIILCIAMLLSFAVIANAETIDAVNQGGFSLGSIDGEQVFADALNNFNQSGIVTDSSDVMSMADAGVFDDVQTLFAWNADSSSFASEGRYVADFMYNVKQDLMWNRHVTYYDTKGTETTDDDVAINTKGDIGLSFANVNVHLRRILNNKYGGQNIFLKSSDGSPDCDDYATAIASFLYNLCYPTDSYQTITIEFPGTQTVSTDDFYGTIVEKSGFGEIIQKNWCDQKSRINFKPVLYVLGIDFDNILESEYDDGFRLGKKIVRYAIEKILNIGPINYLFDIIWAYARTYHVSLREPTLALLSLRIAERSGDETKQPMTMDDLDTLTGLANLIFNNFDSTDTSKLQFMTVPTVRLGKAEGTSELFLYILTYLNMNVKYANNANLLSDMTVLNSIFDEDIVAESFYKSVFLADYTLKDGSATDIDGFVAGYSLMYEDTLNNAPNDIFDSIKRTLQRIFKAIADYFDNLFKLLTGEKEFGKA